jgi:hypothetical protein
MTTFYAQPYNGMMKGFWFDSVKTFDEENKKHSHLNGEYEIYAIAGDVWQVKLANAIGADLNLNVELWYEMIEDMEESELIATWFLVEHHGFSIKEAIEKFDDVIICNQSIDDYAYDLVHEIYDVPDGLKFYIDYASFGRDLILGGDVVELARELLVTNANDI